MDKKTLGKPLYIRPREIPPRKRASYDWDDVFESIPEDMTRVFHDEVNYCTISSVLKKFKKMGKYPNIEIETRKENGKRVTYVTKRPAK